MEAAPRVPVRVRPPLEFATTAVTRRSVEVYGPVLAARGLAGIEFDSFRPYVPGDDPRQLDGKVSARRGSPHVRVLRPERGQTVMLVVDTGRRMGVRVEGTDWTRLDYAAGAAVALARAAAGHGDRFGLLAYDDRVRLYLRPSSGATAARRVTEAMTDLDASSAEPDPVLAFAHLSERQGRRCLVLVLTDVADPEASRPLAASIARIAARHLPVVVTVSDPAWRAAAVAAPGEGAIRRLAARDLAHAAERAVTGLRRAGARCRSVPAQELPRAALGAYEEVKALGRL
jgi:uncharacterized protein (DUF58 family)